MDEFSEKLCRGKGGHLRSKKIIKKVVLIQTEFNSRISEKIAIDFLKKGAGGRCQRLYGVTQKIYNFLGGGQPSFTLLAINPPMLLFSSDVR